MRHFLGITEALPDFWNRIHELPLLSRGVRRWADVLGRPASFGCIILDLEAAERMYTWAEEGAITEIQRWRGPVPGGPARSCVRAACPWALTQGSGRQRSPPEDPTSVHNANGG